MSTTATKEQPNRASRSTGRGSKSKASKTASAKATTPSAKTAKKDGGKSLGPGALDGLLLGYMKRNPKKLPATSGVVNFPTGTIELTGSSFAARRRLLAGPTAARHRRAA